MAKPLKPLIRGGGGFYPSNKWTPLVYNGGYTTADGGEEPSDPLNTFTGKIVQFLASAVKPIVNLTATLSPIQDLHGYDSPWPSGGGANQWDEVWEIGDISSATGQNGENDNLIRSKNYIPIVGGATYYAKVGTITGNLRARFYDSSKAYIGYETKTGGLVQCNSTFTVKDNAAYMRFATPSGYGNTYGNNISINSPSTATTYSPYRNLCPISGHTGVMVHVADGENPHVVDNEYPITFPDAAGTVYGGTLTVNEDGSGTLTVDRVCKTVVGDLIADYRSFAGAVGFNINSPQFADANFNKPILCNKLETIGPSQSQYYGACKWSGTSFYFWFQNGAFTDYADAVAKTNAEQLQCCYYLAQPLTYTLTPEQVGAVITTLKGQNNVWVDDSDEISVTAYGTEVA